MPVSQSSDDAISVLGLLNILLRRRAALVGVPTVVAGLAVGAYFVLPTRYSAIATFVPETAPEPRLPAGLAGLASQLNISFGGTASQSPRFYADLVGSREIEDQVLLSCYRLPNTSSAAPDSARLIEILGTGGRDLADSLERARRKLERRVSARVNAQTGIVRLEVVARYPSLAAEIANRFVMLIDQFNTQYRQSQAREQRRFVETRAGEAAQALRGAEDSLKAFYERNRLWQQASHLVFEEGRLRRQVEVQQDVYLTLRRELETAKIEEVNDTPVITIIDRAVPPHRRSSPRFLVLLVSAVVTGAVIALGWAFGVEYLKRLRDIDAAAYQELSSHLHSARMGLKKGASNRMGSD